MAFPVFVRWFQGRPYRLNTHGHYPLVPSPGPRRQGKDLHPHLSGNHTQQAALPGGTGAGDKVAQQESQKALPSQLPRHKKPDSSRGPDPFQIYIPSPMARHGSPTSGCAASSLVSLGPVPPLE